MKRDIDLYDGLHYYCSMKIPFFDSRFLVKVNDFINSEDFNLEKEYFILALFFETKTSVSVFYFNINKNFKIKNHSVHFVDKILLKEYQKFISEIKNEIKIFFESVNKDIVFEEKYLEYSGFTISY